MKIKVKQNNDLQDDEIEIHINKMTPEIEAWLEALNKTTILGYRRGKEYHLNVDECIFFETDLNGVYAHTKDAFFETKYKLYELEELLPKSFMRISKSGIVNMKEISALDQKLTSSRTVSFHNSQKTMYVSRKFYPLLKEKLAERSF